MSRVKICVTNVENRRNVKTPRTVVTINRPRTICSSAVTYWGEKRAARRVWVGVTPHNALSQRLVRRGSFFFSFFFFLLFFFSRDENPSAISPGRYLDKIRGSSQDELLQFPAHYYALQRVARRREEQAGASCVRASSKLPPPGQPRKSVSERAETTPLWYPMSLLANSATGGPLIRAACSREQPENPEGNSNCSKVETEREREREREGERGRRWWRRKRRRRRVTP